MEIFRIAKKSYATRLTSSGSANRWNRRGQYVLYAGSSRSLSTLELVVHKNAIQPIEPYNVMVLSIADEDRLFRHITLNELPDTWRSIAAYATLQEMGAKWYESKETLALKVPSAVIPVEHNYIINTEHPDFSRCVALVRTEEYFWDPRLV